MFPPFLSFCFCLLVFELLTSLGMKSWHFSFPSLSHSKSYHASNLTSILTTLLFELQSHDYLRPHLEHHGASLTTFTFSWKRRDLPFYSPCCSSNIILRTREDMIRPAAAVLRTGFMSSQSEMSSCKSTQIHVFWCASQPSVSAVSTWSGSFASYCPAVWQLVWLWIKWPWGWNES